jgi:DNA-binding MarR family transcriptional regulator
VLKRVRSHEDRRVARLTLTPGGEAVAAQRPAIFTDTLETLLSGFSRKKSCFLKACCVAC